MSGYHVKTTLQDDNKSWCGESLSTDYFYFKDAEHATINGAVDGEKSVCRQCSYTITKYLNKGGSYG